MIEKGSHTTENAKNEKAQIDQSLLDALIKGEEAAFEKIYKSYFALLRNYSASIVGDSDAAYEIIQNIFVALWENRKNLDREKSLRNYLLRSAHNNSLRYLKTQSLHLQHQENLKKEKSEEEQENVIRHEEYPDPEQQLSALLNELPERSRQVVIMSHIENKKSADIARELGISVRTVETILYQAMKKLRGKIKK
ncbi:MULTISPECIES: RNA polymerase sigma-70 factor [Butyricimonas]|mgnify:FL=1|jgi:RNA polymerase sigma-70 factor|uniref:RNA polymerase sigma-70 factor n=1 Tax=Butyricimonas hominis TaxID=2763032 RepID=A0ABR7D0Z7_9BACT|nr:MULTISPECIES: RNA polymerase sigma-70 factor [Butyricimonas]MBC5621621.1 RNA polymerase sigma-70 factor [Butyricimonas hominis]MCB6972869.1 RNA polymerase sigma-70 factor [Butyricimonas synergistica]MCG4518405.1 RNA polymerase sigma-70 factor [Butyricimonas sp. DFI.6.44]